MDAMSIYSSTHCKNEILAEISFYNKASTTKHVKLLCSRLLARYRFREDTITYEVLEENCLNNIDTPDENHVEEHIASDCKDKRLTNDEIQCSEDINEPCTDSHLQAVSSSEDVCSSVLEQFKDLSTSEYIKNAEWYAYWEEHGENYVTKTWLEQYGNCSTVELSTDIDDLYNKHREQQYHILYWKYTNYMSENSGKIDDYDYEDDLSNEASSSSDVDLYDIDNISCFEFIYKYKNFDNVNAKIVKAYRALSLMGFVYDNGQNFRSACVEYLKTNLIKSSRHLNIYRFPKTDKLSFSDNISKNDFEASKKKKGKKSNKSLKKDTFKQEKAKQLDEELERYGCSYMKNNPKLLKYWKKRFFLFSKFDKGIQLDEESWYSVTPELISSYIADRCSCHLLVDAFCGAGGNSIRFAKTCELVIAIDIDPKKIEIARHNAEIYGVSDRIQFIVGDYFVLAPTLVADVVFLSPPWGGPNLMTLENYKLCDIMAENGGGEHLLSTARQITPDVAIHLPKNINIFDCIRCAENSYVEVQQNVLNSRYNSITVYYNELYGLSEEDTVEYEL